ncbi:MAG: hypothetical protein AAB632_01505, partial [Patescibacteria group bacterium]
MSKKIVKIMIVPIAVGLFLGLGTVMVRAQNSQAPTSSNGSLKKEAQQENVQEKKASLKQKNLEQAKEKVNADISRVIKKLNKTKDRVAAMPNIENSLKTQLNLKIDESITKLNTRKTTVDAATTKEELQSAMEGFKTEVKEAKKIVKDIVEAIHKTHLQTVITKMETFITKVEERVAAITDTSKKAEAEGLVLEAKTKLTNT